MVENDDEKVKLELELPKDEANIEPQPETLKRAQKLGEAHEKVKQKMKEVEEKEEKLKQKEKELAKKEEEEETTVAGYKPAEIAKAPLEPPEPEDKKAPSSHQRRVMVFGLALVALGIVLWPLISFGFGLALAIAGAAVIAFATLVRV